MGGSHEYVNEFSDSINTNVSKPYNKCVVCCIHCSFKRTASSCTPRHSLSLIGDAVHSISEDNTSVYLFFMGECSFTVSLVSSSQLSRYYMDVSADVFTLSSDAPVCRKLQLKRKAHSQRRISFVSRKMGLVKK